MKKHPIDDLFKRKLADLEKKPSDNAWSKIQQDTEEKRRPAVWIWYAAASVVIALIAGYAVWQNDGAGREINSGTQKMIASAVEKRDVARPEVIKKANSQQVAVENKQGIQPGSIDEAVQIEKPKTMPNKIVENSEAEDRQKQKIAIAESKQEEFGKQPESVVETPKLEIPKLAESLAMSQVSKPQTEPAITIVVAVQTNDDEVGEKPKSSKFSRVFRQLKNARAGERVDWEEVGFNPKNLVARVDDRLRNKEEVRNAEKDQNPKQKTKL